jgi:hypothetical protein
MNEQKLAIRALAKRRASSGLAPVGIHFTGRYVTDEYREGDENMDSLIEVVYPDGTIRTKAELKEDANVILVILAFVLIIHKFLWRD